MSTATANTTTLGRDARPGLGQLISVELRKMYDTRAGFWLLLSPRSCSPRWSPR